MQIRLSWQLLAAVAIFIVALAMIVRSLVGQGADPTVAVSSPSALANPTGTEPATVAPTTVPLPASPTATQPAPTPAPSPPPPPTSTASAQPTETPSPIETATQPPTLTATPAPAAAVVVTAGFVQLEERITYGFVIFNPNQDLIVRDLRYQAIIYDQGGLVIGADNGTIAVIGAAQQTGALGTVSLPDATLQAARSEIILGGGQFLQAVPLPPFPVESLALLPGDDPVITALVRNPYPQDLSDLPVVALIFDDNDRVIGGGSGTIPFLPQGGQAAATVPVVYSTPSQRVALFPRLETILAP